MCSRNHGGKKVICKNETCEPLAGFLSTIIRNFAKKKVSGNFFQLRGAVGCKIVKKEKKKEKKTYGKFFSCGFPFPVIKKAENVDAFPFCSQGRRKKLKKIFKNNFFFSFRELFHHFGSLIFWKR